MATRSIADVVSEIIPSFRLVATVTLLLTSLLLAAYAWLGVVYLPDFARGFFLGTSSALALSLLALIIFRRKGTRVVAIIGPPGAGKTVLLGGIFYEATGLRSRAIMHVVTGERYLSAIVQEMLKGRWPPRTPKDTVTSVEFSITEGPKLLERKVTIASIDYAGELLDRIVDNIPTRLKIDSREQNLVEETLRVADAIVIVLPADEGSPFVELFYKRILDAIARARNLSPRRKLSVPVAVVVTKWDLFARNKSKPSSELEIREKEPEVLVADRRPVFYDILRTMTLPSNRYFFGTSVLPSEGRLFVSGVSRLLEWLLLHA